MVALDRSTRSVTGFWAETEGSSSRLPGRFLWFIGCFFMAMPSIRLVSELNVSDSAFFLSAVVMILKGGSRHLSPQPAYGVATVLAIGAAMLASYNAVDLSQNWTVLIRLAYLWLVWRLQARIYVADLVGLERSMTLFVGGAAISGVVGVAQVVFGVGYGGGLQGWEQVRAAGLSGHVNDQGGTLGLAAVMAVGFWLSSHNRRIRFVLLCSLPGVSAGLVFSGSISGMLCAAVGVVILIAFQPRGTRSRGFFFATLAVAGFWGLALIQQAASGISPLTRLISISGENGDVSTVATRLQTDTLAWQSILRSPLVGAGMDTSSGAILNGATAVHNVFLLYWFQGGVFLLAALLVILISSYARLRHVPASPAKRCIVVALASILVYAQTAPVTFERFFWLPFVLIAALPLSAPSEGSPVSKELQGESPTGWLHRREKGIARGQVLSIRRTERHGYVYREDESPEP